jgi:hypothetical protein
MKFEAQLSASKPMTQLAHLEMFPSAVREMLGRGVATTQIIVANAMLARQYWALWEALNDRLEPGRPLPEALAWYAPPGLGTVRRALVEATILAGLRVSEGPGEDRQSACVLCSLLWNEDVTKVLVSENWIMHGKAVCAPEIISLELKNQPKRIEWFKSNVPCGWARGDPPPADGKLKETRGSLKDIRDKLIAHSLEGEIDMPCYDEVREALRVATQIAEKASLIFLGHTSGLDASLVGSVRSSDKLWDLFERGLVSAHQDWLAEHQKLANKAE